MRVVTYNVHSCVGVDRKHSPERVADVLAGLRPDVVALQEVDLGGRRSRGRDQAAEIAVRLGMDLHFQPSRTIRGGFYGNAVMSKYPVRLMRAGLFRPLPALERRGAMWVLIDTPLGPVHLVNTHLGLLRRERLGQLRELMGEGWLGHAELSGPILLAGDFNSTPRSPEYRRLTSRLADATGATAVRTYPGRAPLWQLDHLFGCARLRPTAVEVPRCALARTASDHLPLLVEFTGSGPAAGSA
ncbi:MAG: endonuclease/exonuclease/phosphatase family protein [Candidatus Eremiobacterota bacterium]